MSDFDFNEFAKRMGITPRTKPTRDEEEDALEQATEQSQEPTNATKVRPGDVAGMVGQTAIRVQLMAHLTACKVRDEQPGHALCSGPPGLGKTTLAKIIAAECGSRLIENEASSVSSPQKIAMELGKIQAGDVFFIDEIHALSRTTQEILGKAMEDGYFTMSTGQGKTTTSTVVRLPRFTLVGATTLSGNLTGPLRDRFAFTATLSYYEDDELSEIITKDTPKLNADIEEDAAIELGARSRGTPRIALNYLRKAIDFATASSGDAKPLITAEVIEQALTLYDIDFLGLNPTDRTVLYTLFLDHIGGPAGLRNLSASSGVDERTIRDVIEPYLIRARLIRRTTRGRLATKRAFRHFNLKPLITLDQDVTRPEAM